jgi:NADH dehydrogenase FAD-containing subunit
LGDCAAVKTVSGKEAPPTAQHAIREATTAATNIAAAIRGGERAAFAFEGLGTLGSLGHGAAVAQILGVKLSGVFAWILWRCIYLMKMPGPESQGAHRVRLGAASAFAARSRADQATASNRGFRTSTSRPATWFSNRAIWATACT